MITIKPLSDVNNVFDNARNAYNGLPDGVRAGVTIVVAIVLGVLILKFVTGLVGRIISAVIGAVVTFALWHYLPQITAHLGL